MRQSWEEGKQWALKKGGYEKMAEGAYSSTFMVVVVWAIS